MFQCCSAPRQVVNMADRIKPCPTHKKPMLFVCTNYQTCSSHALFCTDCSDMHKGHQWETVNDFFTPELTDRVLKNSSDHEEQLEEVFQKIKDMTGRFKAKIDMRMIEIEEQIKVYEEELKEKYPSLNPGGKNKGKMQEISIKEHEFIDNDKMKYIMRIHQNSQNNEWLEDLNDNYRKVLEPTENGLDDTLEKFHQLIKDRKWDDEESRKKKFKEYLEKYAPPELKPDPFYFRFSEADKNQYVKVTDRGVQATYSEDIYSNVVHPAVVSMNTFTEVYNKATFKIKKLDKAVLFFDISTIFVGACLTKVAREFSFSNLEKPSHGAFMISSKGQVYHTKLPEIDGASCFSFGEEDQISVWVDFDYKTINFEKKGKIKNSTYSMDLAIKDKYMSKLKPCIGFSGQKNACVCVLPIDVHEAKKRNRK